MSTKQAIIDLQSNIVQTTEKKHKACFIFLDVVKAFDSVNCEILLSKLEYYGIKDTLLFLFKSYLSNRQQCVKVNQSISKTKSITCGVPQVSMLGLLLFSVIY